jgi:hypothetical protein
VSVILGIRQGAGIFSETSFSAGAYLIGRDGRRCDLVLRDDRVSRRHMALVGEGTSWFALDLGSSNGLQVNGVRRDYAPLCEGDELLLGGTQIRIHLRVQEGGGGAEDALRGDGIQGVEGGIPERLRAGDLAARRGCGPLGTEAELEFLLDANRLALALPEVDDFSGELCRLARATFGCDRALLFLSQNGSWQLWDQDCFDLTERPSPLARRMVSVAADRQEVLVTRHLGQDRLFRGGRDREGYDAASALP